MGVILGPLSISRPYPESEFVLAIRCRPELDFLDQEYRADGGGSAGMDSAARLTVLVVALALTLVFGLLRRRRDGRATVVASGAVLTAADLPELSGPLGTRATYLQFSSPACSPCRSVRRVLDGVVAGHPELGHLEIDATERLDLARRLDVMRTPTVLVLDPGGRVVSRVSGPLDPQQALDALPAPSGADL
jgi:thiol-disulfide isomerase/thioredoxin